MAIVAAAVSTVLWLPIGISALLVVALLSFIVVCAALFVVVNRHSGRTVLVCRWIALILFADLLVPLGFIQTGGPLGSVTPFFVLSIVVVFLLTDGVARVVMVFITCAINAGCIVVGFVYPQTMDSISASQLMLSMPVNVVIAGLALGSIVLFHYSIRRRSADALLQRLQQQELMTNISQVLSAEPFSTEMLEGVLGRIGAFMRTNRVMITRSDIKGGSGKPEYIWMQSPAWAPRKPEFAFEDSLQEYFPATPPTNGDIPYLAVDDIVAFDGGVFRLFHDQLGVYSVIWIPMYADNYLWGFLDIEQCDGYRTWSASDKLLARMLASSIAGTVARELIDEDRHQALDAAIKASQAKGEFLANMSHEMRTPLNAIIGMTTLGLRASVLERKDYAFTRIEDASRHLLGVINDVLDMSKIEAGKFELSPTDFELKEALDSVRTIIGYSARNAGITFNATVDPAIPAVLYGDEQHLMQVVVNLLSNAVKFTPAGGQVGLTLTLAANEDGEIAIDGAVSDTGIGISAEQQEHLFGAFEQADSSTSRRYGGTGLGLAISQSIVGMMGGFISVSSEPGQGSTFSFRVWMREGNASALEMPAVSAAVPASEQEAPDFSAYRLLIAEDIPINSEIVIGLLESTGVKTVCAEDGQQALELFEREHASIDAILMDVQMPQMDGLEATRRIRELTFPDAQSVPIIAMTANVFTADIDACLAAGMDAHISKPVDYKDLIATLLTYLPTR
jgi:signal transduction histidine kinase